MFEIVRWREPASIWYRGDELSGSLGEPRQHKHVAEPIDIQLRSATYNAVSEVVVTEINKKMRYGGGELFANGGFDAREAALLTPACTATRSSARAFLIYDPKDLDSRVANRLCHSTSEYAALAKRAG